MDEEPQKAVPAPSEASAAPKPAPGEDKAVIEASGPRPIGTHPLFPDLPDHLVPGRADGTGSLSLAEIRQIESMGTAQLVAPSTRDTARQASEHLQLKLAQTVQTFTQGGLNQQQFEAIFARYARQKAIIDRILAQGGEQGAAPVSEGQTAALKRHHEARALGLIVIDQRSQRVLKEAGRFEVPRTLLGPVLGLLQAEAGSEPMSTQIEGGRWLCLVSGRLSSSVLLFDKEPSGAQISEVEALHREFEERNSKALQSQQTPGSELRYPQLIMIQ